MGLALLALAALLTLRHALHAQGVKVVDLMIVGGIAIMMVMMMMMMMVNNDESADGEGEDKGYPTHTQMCPPSSGS